MKIGIIGAGKIAVSMAKAISNHPKLQAYAVASRSLEKAEEFRALHNFKKAYGSYEELCEDEEVELIYVATPHNFHFAHAKLCLEHHKPVIVEKPFTVNAKEAEELFSLSKKYNTFITEAMWTRYMPSRVLLQEVVNSGIIGDIAQVSADLSYMMKDKERIIKKELAGGALLDIGIYPLSFAQMVFNDEEPEAVKGYCTYLDSGVDANDSITLFYKGNRTAVLSSSMQVASNRQGVIYGSDGYIVVDHIGNIDGIHIYDADGKHIKDIAIPEQINGYEYEMLACKRALEMGALECEEHSHRATLQVLGWMDELRKAWGIVYPFE